jgi:hypothetical protein
MFRIIKIIFNIFNKNNKIHCLNVKEVKKRKKKKVVAWKGIFESDMLNCTCPICLDKGNMNIKLPCGHWFHKKCILEWFKNSDNCPLCRLNIKKEINKYKVYI